MNVFHGVIVGGSNSGNAVGQYLYMAHNSTHEH